MRVWFITDTLVKLSLQKSQKVGHLARFGVDDLLQGRMELRVNGVNQYKMIAFFLLVVF